MILVRSPSAVAELEDRYRSWQPTIDDLESIVAGVPRAYELRDHTPLLGIGGGRFKLPRGKDRALFAHQTIAEHDLLVLLGITSHVDDSYERAYEPLFDGDTAWFDERLFRPDQLLELVGGCHPPDHAQTPPRLAKAAQPWLVSPGRLSDRFLQDVMIYETRQWTRAAAAPAMAGHLDALHSGVRSAVAALIRSRGGSETVQPPAGTDGTWQATAQLLHVGTRTAVVLDGLRVDGTETQTWASELGGSTDLDDLAPHCRRAYPHDRLADRDRWVHLQSTDEAAEDPCLPLSEDEIEILDLFAEPGALPMLLDGPAGSGKTTLLGYITAALIVHAAQTESTGGPLYVTHGRRLRDLACRRVQAHLRFHFGVEPKELQRWTESFRTTDQLATDLVADPEFFAPDKKVGFNEYRQWFQQLHDAILLSSEESWFVIRAFIEGRAAPSQNGEKPRWFDPESFNSLPEDQRDGVHMDAYEQIYERVFPRYLRLLDGGHWDEQTLTLAALAAGQVAPIDPNGQPRWMALICDEAQDLTANDLRLLLGQLGTVQFDVRHLGRVALPFVFAADPQQTVNPSGFDWPGFQGRLHDETSLLLGPESAVRAKPRPLRWNYRSPQTIVEVGSSVLALRKESDRLLGRQPRTVSVPRSWCAHEGRFVRHLLTEQSAHDLAVALRSTPAVIVPCLDGGERAYVAEHPLLSEAFGEDLEQLDNVYSPMEAKGREFSTVALVGFGERFTEIWETRPHLDRGPKARPKEVDFTLNALYVAVTRARESLNFIDPPAADAELWGEHGLSQWIAAPPPDPELAPDALIDTRGLADAAEDAFRRGVDGWDPEELARASGNFRRIGSYDRMRVAELWRDLVGAEHQPNDVLCRFAAEQLLDGLEKDLWRLPRWELLRTLDSLGLDAPDEVAAQRRAAAAFDKNPDDSATFLTLSDSLDRLRPKTDDKLWAEVGSRYCHRVITGTTGQEAFDRELQAGEWRTVAGAVGQLPHHLDGDALAWITARSQAGELNEALNDLRDLPEEDLLGWSASDLQVVLTYRATGLHWIPNDLLIEALRQRTNEGLDLDTLLDRALSDAAVRERARRLLPQLAADERTSPIVLRRLLEVSLDEQLDLVTGTIEQW